MTCSLCMVRTSARRSALSAVSARLLSAARRLVWRGSDSIIHSNRKSFMYCVLNGHNGGINMNARIDNVRAEVKKGVFPSLGLDIRVSRDPDPSGQYPDLHLLLATVKLILNGDCIAASEPLLSTENWGSNQINFNADVPFPRDVIDTIEATRVDDLPLTLGVDMLCSYSDAARENRTAFFRSNLYHDLKKSQKEWAEILKKMGYSESWIFEIARPTLEGMDVVAEHLQKASDNLSARDYEGCMANTRIAWDAFKPLLDSKWDEIKALIDEDSQGESNHDPKSTRIKDIRDKIHYLANVGIHREAYKIQPDDAILCYYLTVSMVSYLSKLLKKAT